MHKVYKYIITVLILLFVSCTTIRANKLLIEETTHEEKAELLFTVGVKKYNTLILENNDLRKLDKVKQHFTDTLVLNPEHRGATEYIEILEEFRTTVSNESIETALELYAKVDRTMEEDYKLVLAVTQALDLKVKHDSLSELKKETKDLKEIVIENHTAIVLEIESRILNETDYNKLLKDLRRAKIRIKELIFLDPKNKTAESSYINIITYIEEQTLNDLDTAQDFINEGQYIKAELLIRQTEFKYNAINDSEIDGIDNIKYELFYLWGASLLSQGKFETSRNITLLAKNIRNTKEVRDLINSIDNRISKRSYEASINDILDSIDYYISINELVKAKRVIDDNLYKVTLKKNKTALNNKITYINNYIDELYQKGEKLYKDEDYEGALENFTIVYNYNKDYQLTESYYNKALNKSRALSGSF